MGVEGLGQGQRRRGRTGPAPAGGLMSRCPGSPVSRLAAPRAPPRPPPGRGQELSSCRDKKGMHRRVTDGCFRVTVTTQIR